MAILVLNMHPEDLNAAAQLYKQYYPKHQDVTRWLDCNLSAFPRVLLYVARDEKDNVVGCIRYLRQCRNGDQYLGILFERSYRVSESLLIKKRATVAR